MPTTTALERRANALSKPATDANAVAPGHAPAARRGEDSMSSRPFSILKMCGLVSKAIEPEFAKTELALTTAFKKALEETNCRPEKAGAGSWFYPGSRPLLPYAAAYHKATTDILEAAGAGMMQADPDEMSWIGAKLAAQSHRNQRFDKSYEPMHTKSAMSYLYDNIGGTLVAPPEMGELIPLMRNQSAVDRAGARMVPLPPQGKWIAPRVTGPSTGYWIGENTTITQSNPTTGQVEMMAKKLGVLVLVPNELFKYASVAADAMLREDMAKTLSLGYDFACLYGTSGSQPKGLVYYTDTNEVLFYTASQLGTNGNTLQPQDGYIMSATIEDRNFDLKNWKWIMRPLMWGYTASLRASVLTTGDQLGLFVQDLTRTLGAGAPPQWTGYPVVRSSQVRNTLTKGSANNLTEVWGGAWNEFLCGLYGAVEFATATQGDTMFANDQTTIRGILHADSCPRYPGAFAVCQSLIQ